MHTASLAGLVLGLLALSVSHTGCNTSDSWGSCDMGMLCIEYTGYEWNTDSITRRCDGYGGELTEDDCPVENLIGECINDQGLEQEYIEHFYSPYFEESESGSLCRSGGGVWRPAG